jgi:hypothetical protein
MNKGITMKTNRYKIFLFLSILLALSLACVLTGGEPEPEPEPAADSGDTIATAVAATLAAGQADTPPTDQPTVQPTATAAPELPPEPDIIFQGVSFSIPDSLAGSINAQEIPAQPEGFTAQPAHLRFDLVDYALPGGYLDPVIKVFPVAEFKLVNEFAGQRLDNLQTLLDTQPADPDGMPIPDFAGAAQFVGTQVDYVNFQNGRGVRYVSQWGQAAYPVGFPQLFYSFQGLSDDGLYYVHVVLSVDHPSLPAAETVTLDNAFYENFETYAAEMEAHLDSQTPESFEPSLLLLDELVKSLLVGQ